MSDSDNQLTRADRGVLVYEALTQFFQESLKGKDATATQTNTIQYRDAVHHLTEATGARFTLPPTVNTLTTDEKAVTLAQAIRRAQQFITSQLRTMDFSITIERPRKKLKNIVDYQLYDHLATVRTADNKVVYFAISAFGSYVLSESDYWEDVV